MSNKPIHVTPRNGGDQWAVTQEQATRASRIFDTQHEAEKYGRQQARAHETEFFLHGRNGQIRERDSYGNDPCPPRDNN